MGVTQNLDSIKISYDVKFRDGLTSMTAALNWEMMADKTQSINGTSTYPINARTTQMREWLGERVVRENEVMGYSLKNRKWEATVAVKVDDVEDDLYGNYNNQMEALGKAAARLPYDRVIQAIIDGDVTACYDGEFFFDTDHPIDPFGEIATTYSNDLSSTALTAATVQTTRTAMTTRLDKYGVVMGVRPTHLVVPEALRLTAQEIVIGTTRMQTAGTAGTDLAASSPSNLLSGALGLIVVPELDADSATTWYMADFGQSVKPLFWQERVAPTFDQITSGIHVVSNDEYVFGSRARGAAGYNLPQLMTRCAA